MIRLGDLEKQVKKYHPEADLEFLKRAYDFSAREHKDQVRQSGEPYLTHPLEVANILAQLRLDITCVSVGLLHDVVEDTFVSLETIRNYFGKDVADMVDALTKISKIGFSSKRHKQAENFRKLILAMVSDIRVIFVKLADRLHNMRTLEFLPEKKRKLIARETLDIYAPIAHRLGVVRLRGELEDLSFSHLEPVAYRKIANEIRRKKDHSKEFTQIIIREMVRCFKEQDIDAEIKSRIKNIYSTYQKMNRQQIGLDQVYDFIAIRVVVNTVRDCYTVLGIVNNEWNPVPGRIKDFIAMPRPNMYQALQTTVIGHDGRPFEIQIRTVEMDRLAEDGIAAHWRYKEGKLEEDQEDKRFQWLRQLLEWQKEVKDPNQFLSNLKIDLYPKEVYAFTPKGKIMTLPRGATPVDFAYMIHTEIGHQCIGAKVNGRIVPLKYKLGSGEIVEILTSKKKGHPSPDWLNFIKTSRARSAVRRWINLKQEEKALELGRRLLEERARKYKINLKKHQFDLQAALPDFNVSTLEDLLVSIGFGKVDCREVLRRLDIDKVKQQGEEHVESKLTRVVNKVFRRSTSAIQVKGHDDLFVYRAHCCAPIRGEEIIGYLRTGKGILVHTVSCPNVQKLLLNPERQIAVKWTQDGGDATYPVRLLVSIEDRTGMLADIALAVSEMGTNILSVKARAPDGRYGLIDLTVAIEDTNYLGRILDKIRTVEGVREVERDLTGGGAILE